MDKILSVLYKSYPDLHYYLTYDNPVQLVVAAILSPQVRDEVVNETTKPLFQRLKTANDFAKTDILNDVRKITFAGNKAKHVKAAATLLQEKHDGKVPKTVKELVELPGVGEKTAHAILQNAYDIVEGIVVDTHVLRVSYRLGYTSHQKNPKIVQRELEKVIPKNHWKDYPWLMKAHGRAICKAPTPYCSKCPIEKTCPKKGVTKSL